MSEDEEKEKRIVHRMEIDRSPEIESLREEMAGYKKELEEKKSLLEAAGIEAFERKQADLKKQYPKGAELIDLADPTTIDSVEGKLRTIFKQPIIAGKSSMISRGSGSEEEFSSSTEMIDRLYNTAFYTPRKHDEKWREEHAEEIEDAKAKIKTLISSMIESPSWKQLKERGTRPILKHNLTECPKCHFTKVDTSLCGNCGYDATEKQKTVKFRDFKGEDI